jgi:sugar lactone lactonase YvrE
MNAGALTVGPRGALYATDYARNIVCVFRPRGSLNAPWDISTVQVERSPGSDLDRCVIPSANHRVAVSTIQLALPGSAGDRARPVRVGSLPWPAGIATDSQGRLYVADRQHDQIARFSASGKPLKPIGSYGHAPGQLDTPSDVAVDQDGNIFVADTGNNRIQQLSPGGKSIYHWTLRGTFAGPLADPVSVAVDWKGDIFVSDYRNNRVVKLSLQGDPVWHSRGQRAATQ